MATGSSLDTDRILEAFTREVDAHGGTVTDTFDDGARLFVRSVLPQVADVRAGDRLQGGVALRAFGDEVWVHPYVFRLVCTNGAIMAHSITSRQVTVDFDLEPVGADDLVREAVGACCRREVFAASVGEIRSARDTQVDFALNVLPLLARLQGRAGGVVQHIVERFLGEPDRTRYSLMNAVTSVARDTADPQVRWELEELGGGIPANGPTTWPQSPLRTRAARREAAAVC